LLFEDKVGFYN
jgi:hypothetical protein